jgi:hypothetical protein
MSMFIQTYKKMPRKKSSHTCGILILDHSDLFQIISTQNILSVDLVLFCFSSVMFQQVHGGECSTYPTTFHLVEDKS